MTASNKDNGENKKQIERIETAQTSPQIKNPLQNKLPIVAIGASAGGLEVLKQLFTSLPANTGAAYVVITHLDPTHASAMTSIIQNFTEMTTVTIEEGMNADADMV